MKPYENEFNRFEFKYWITNYQKQRLIEYFNNFMNLDPHNDGANGYKIQSLYFDSRDLRSYFEKYNGDNYRTKYRIRFYGNDYTNANFEIKKKKNIYVSKTRNLVDLTDPKYNESLDRAFMSPPPDVESYIAMLQQLNFSPVCWVAYQRLALSGKNNPSLRVTFDNNLSGAMADGLSLSGVQYQPVRLSNWHTPTILEIKFSQHMPTWLRNAIEDFGLMNQPISKYNHVINRHKLFFLEERSWTH